MEYTENSTMKPNRVERWKVCLYDFWTMYVVQFKLHPALAPAHNTNSTSTLERTCKENIQIKFEINKLHMGVERSRTKLSRLNSEKHKACNGT